jgi:hypothetical protein
LSEARAGHKNAEWYYERMLAVKSMTDQKLLADFAMNTRYSTLGRAAVRRVTDGKLLVSIAKCADEYDTRIAALEQLTDQPGSERGTLPGSSYGIVQEIRHAAFRWTRQVLAHGVPSHDSKPECNSRLLCWLSIADACRHDSKNRSRRQSELQVGAARGTALNLTVTTLLR